MTGGNGTDTAIWTTWSDWTEGYTGSWEAYSESGVDISTIMSARFPYGLLKVGSGSSAVYDEIDFVHKQAISRVSRVAYSDEARAAAAAAGRAYEFDENYIYQARASEVVNSITIDEKYTVSEHGLEYFASSTIPVYSEILYGQNLKDKLKRNVVTLSEQTLTGGQKGQVRANIGAAAASELNSLENGLAIVVEGNKTAYASGAAIGDYVFVKNSTITDITDGLYKAAKAIPYNTTVDKTYFTACPKGLGGEVASLSDQIGTKDVDVTPGTGVTLGSGFSAKRTGNVISIVGSFTTTGSTNAILSTGVVGQTRFSELLDSNMAWTGKTVYNNASGDIYGSIPAGTYILNHVFVV